MLEAEGMIRRIDVARRLAKGPATLAELLERFPSVGKGTSNFIRGEVFHMRKAGLVQNDGKVWSLTEKGRRYVEGRRLWRGAGVPITSATWT